MQKILHGWMQPETKSWCGSVTPPWCGPSTKVPMVLVATRNAAAGKRLRVDYKSSSATLDGRPLISVKFIEDQNICVVHIRADVFQATLASWSEAWFSMQQEGRAEHLPAKSGGIGLFAQGVKADFRGPQRQAQGMGTTRSQDAQALNELPRDFRRRHVVATLCVA